jgi:hypothetical protein
MQPVPSSCPVCESQDGYSCTAQGFGSRDATLFDCEVCGQFAVSRSALEDRNLRGSGWTKVRRAALSHNLRVSMGSTSEIRLLTTYDLEGFLENDIRLPTPAAQAINIIRFIGDRVSLDGSPIKTLGPDFSATIGSPDRKFAMSLIQQLEERGFVTGIDTSTLQSRAYRDVSLTLSGWQEYEEEQAGRTAGKYGFIALKFDDPVLDPLLRDHVKPAIKKLGYDAYDMRDVAEAGIINNIMRVRIRDCAFVIADLTHENAGSYWEAGYAEGLGKPVLYICEKSIFELKKTHFDTNHCTTVLWDTGGIEPFVENLIATLRRSLAI